jgi:hypothetical protein
MHIGPSVQSLNQALKRFNGYEADGWAAQVSNLTV